MVGDGLATALEVGGIAVGAAADSGEPQAASHGAPPSSTSAAAAADSAARSRMLAVRRTKIAVRSLFSPGANLTSAVYPALRDSVNT